MNVWSHCGAEQIDALHLHAEPDQPLFYIDGGPDGRITLAPLTGAVRMNGDERFGI